jgi:hypothetical protein
MLEDNVPKGRNGKMVFHSLKQVLVNVDVIFYLIPLDNFDQTIYESDEINKLEEELKIFGQVMDNDDFEKWKFVVIFTKGDILKKKLIRNDPIDKLKELGFNKDVNYENIVDFYTEIFKKKIINNVNINFYKLGSALEIVELKTLVHNIFDDLNLIF